LFKKNKNKNKIIIDLKKQKKMSSSSSVTNEDLLNLLTILYQGSVRKNPLAVIPVYKTGAQFFNIKDIPTIASDYDLPLPLADIENTLKVGLNRGIFTKSIQNGTQCGFSVCIPKGASYLAFSSPGSGPINPNPNRTVDPNVSISSDPILIYAYNPQMLKVNSKNAELLASEAFLSFPKLSGSFVKYSNNRAPFYGYRGWASTSNYPPQRSGVSQSNKCCKK
jgi:hypothetical protein